MKGFCSLLIWIFLAPIGQGTLSVYLEIEGVPGESQVSNYDEWIEITGVNRSGSAKVTSGGESRSAATYMPQALQISLLLPSGYSQLADFTTGGDAKQISLEMVQSDGGSHAIQTYIFQGCYFSELAMDAKNDGIPTVTLRFEYSRMEWEISRLSDTGKPIIIGSLDYDRIENTITYDIPDTGPEPATDTDGDGMPDTWETLYGFNINSVSDRNLDPDFDGFSNYLEYLSGTHPKQFTSHLKIIKLTKLDGGVSDRLEWSSVSGKSYNVQRATDGLNTANWTTLATIPASAGSSTTYVLPSTSGAKVFYRVVLSP